MLAQSRTLLFGLSSVVAVAAIAFISWRIADQNPRPFSRSEPARPAIVSAPAVAPVEDKLALKGATDVSPAGGAAISGGATFDVVRVEPTGEAVVAGRAKPGDTVRLLNKGVVIAQVKADANGQFAIVPPSLGPGDHLLSLEIDGAAPSRNAQTVTVAVPAPSSKGEVVVALTEPGAATRILSDAAPAASKSVPTELKIRSVEVDDAGGFYATGSGAPGSTVRLSLNGSPVTSVTADPEGRWSLKVERGMNPGAYTVRADHLDSAGRVVAQAEVPFDYPARLANVATRAAGSASASGSEAVVPDLQSVTVQRGDSLWRISQRMLGNGQRYTQIYVANSTQIRNPSKIFPNQVLVVPQGVKATN